MSISSINITRNEVQSAQRLLSVDFIDHTGGVHHAEYSISTVLDVATFTQSEAFNLDIQLQANEENTYLQNVVQGNRPSVADLKFIDAGRANRRAIREMFATVPDAGWMRGMDYILSLTDAQLTAALPEADISVIRSRGAMIKNAAELMRAYVPILAGA